MWLKHPEQHHQRGVVVEVLRQKMRYELREVCELEGRRDHETVQGLLRRMQEDWKQDVELPDTVWQVLGAS